MIDCGEENVGPKTKGMTGTILTLYLAGMALGRATGSLSVEIEEKLIHAFERSVAAAHENIHRCCTFCEQHIDFLAAQSNFTLISDGIGYPAAMEDALKVLETLYVPTAAYEFEEYLHGVNNTIGKGICNFLIPCCPQNADRMQRLDEFCRENGCTDFVVTSTVNTYASDALVLVGSDLLVTQPFETMLFFQVMSALGSEKKEIECDLPKFSDFYDIMNTKDNG